MKKKEKKTVNKSQLINDLDKLKKDLFNFRFQRINSQLKSPAKISETKRIIERLKTKLGEKTNA